MASQAARLWLADPWSAQTQARLRRLYQQPATAAVAARLLRRVLSATFLSSDARRPSLLVCVPCSSYDEALAFDSLPQAVSAVGRNAIVLLVLPDRAAVEVAVSRAARDNLSRLLYFIDASVLDLAAFVAKAGDRGSVLVLAASRRMAAAELAAVVSNAGRARFVDTFPDAGRPGEIALLHAQGVDAAAIDGAIAAGGPVGSPERGQLPAVEATGMLTTVADSGEVVGVSHPWLEALQPVMRPEPVLVDRRKPSSRVWTDLAGQTPIGLGPAAATDLRQVLAPSRITCHANRSGPGNDLMWGFALGHGCRLDYAEDLGADGVSGTALVWGVLRGSDRVVASAVARGGHFLYCDHAYFHRGHLSHYRIILDGHATTALRACPDDRTDALGVELRPWRPSGRHVLVCPPTEHFMRAHGCPNWVENTLSTLRQHTDRPLRIREKPPIGVEALPLEEDLRDCHALVTHSSNVAVEAAVLGVPVFVAPACAAVGVGSTDLSGIERPAMPDRRLWLANLAYAQFSFDEILQGKVLDRMIDYWCSEPVR